MHYAVLGCKHEHATGWSTGWVPWKLDKKSQKSTPFLGDAEILRTCSMSPCQSVNQRCVRFFRQIFRHIFCCGCWVLRNPKLSALKKRPWLTGRQGLTRVSASRSPQNGVDLLGVCAVNMRASFSCLIYLVSVYAQLLGDKYLLTIGPTQSDLRIFCAKLFVGVPWVRGTGCIRKKSFFSYWNAWPLLTFGRAVFVSPLYSASPR